MLVLHQFLMVASPFSSIFSNYQSSMIHSMAPLLRSPPLAPDARVPWKACNRRNGNPVPGRSKWFFGGGAGQNDVSNKRKFWFHERKRCGFIQFYPIEIEIRMASMLRASKFTNFPDQSCEQSAFKVCVCSGESFECQFSEIHYE